MNSIPILAHSITIINMLYLIRLSKTVIYYYSEYDIGLNVLDLISTIVIIGFTIYYRRWMNLTAIEVDNSVVTISDYSI